MQGTGCWGSVSKTGASALGQLSILRGQGAMVTVWGDTSACVAEYAVRAYPVHGCVCRRHVSMYTDACAVGTC